MMKRFQSRLPARLLVGLLLAGAPVWAQEQQATLPSPTQPQSPVEFGDDELYAAVAAELDIQAGIPLFPEDLAELESLRARDAGISDLAGLEYAVHLRELDLRDNRVEDLAPLAGLEKLEWLSVRENEEIEDLSPLAGLTQLQYLNINRNGNISSILPLADLTGLRVLIMRDVEVLGDTREQAVLRGFGELERLNARNTGLTSVAVLLPGLENGLYERQLDLRQNPLGDAELLRPYSTGDELEIEFDRDALLFDPDFLHYFTLRVQREVWDAMNEHLVEYTESVDGRGRSGRYWRADRLEYSGPIGTASLRDVGFRTRGNTTRTIPENPPGSGEYARAHFNIAVHEPLDLPEGSEAWEERRDRRLFDLRKIGFKYGGSEPEQSDGVVREVFAQNFLNDAGVMTSRAGLAHISFEIVQDDGSVESLDYGMYMSFEPVNKSFIDHRWGSDYNDGDLYKNLWQSGGPATLAPDHRLSQDGSRLIGAKDWERNYRPSYDQKNDDPGGAAGSGRSHEQLRAFITELDERSGTELRDYLDEEFAIGRYLRFMAGNLLLGMPDDYRGNFNNYYMYFPEDDSPIEYIPYDYDHGLGGGWEGYYDTARVGIFAVPAAAPRGRTVPRPLVDKVLAIPEYRVEYVDHLEDLLDSRLFAWETYAEFHRGVARLAESEGIRVFGMWDSGAMQAEPSQAVREYFAARIRGVRRDIDVFRYAELPSD